MLSKVLQQAALTTALIAAMSLPAMADSLFSVEGAYARAVAPGQTNSAVFLQLTNNDNQSHALISVDSSVSNVTELHGHTMNNGMMMMRKVEKIDLPAGETVALQPGGLHIMLIGLKDNFKPDAEVQLTLHFDNDSEQQISAPIRPLQMEMMDHGAHQPAH